MSASQSVVESFQIPEVRPARARGSVREWLASAIERLAGTGAVNTWPTPADRAAHERMGDDRHDLERIFEARGWII